MKDKRHQVFASPRLAWYTFCLVTRASRAPTHCCYRCSRSFSNVTTSRPLSLRHNFTLRISTEVYGSTIGYSPLYIAILLTLGSTNIGICVYELQGQPKVFKPGVHWPQAGARLGFLKLLLSGKSVAMCVRIPVCICVCISPQAMKNHSHEMKSE